MLSRAKAFQAFCRLHAWIAVDVIIFCMDRSNLVSIFSSILGSTPGVHLAYLFGSQMGKSTGPLSDVDLGICS